jgi:hypothetical protein
VKIKLEELIKLEACSSGLDRFKSLNLGVATLEQTLSVCTISDVLWYLGQDQSNLSNIVTFAKWCAKEAKTYDAEYADEAARYADKCARYADEAARYAVNAASAASAAAEYATYAAEYAARTKQKAKLLELFS